MDSLFQGVTTLSHSGGKSLAIFLKKELHPRGTKGPQAQGPCLSLAHSRATELEVPPKLQCGSPTRPVAGLVSTSGDASQDSNESNEVAEGLDANWEHRAAGNWCLALLPRCPESEATVRCPS